MSKTGITTIVVIVIVILIGGILYMTGTNQGSPATTAGNYTSATSTVATSTTVTSTYVAAQQSTGTPGIVAGASITAQLFSNSIYATHAYLISSGGNFDANTKQALSGFTIQTSTNANGSMQIILNARKTGYQTQTYTVKPGQKLYFIEASLGDDTGTADNFPSDDHAVLVDSNGYIIQVGSPAP